MSVHGRSFLQYWDMNLNPYRWQSIAMGDLQRVEYTDSIYAPARLHVVISNRDMNRPLSGSVNTSSGTYSVEGEGDEPTFRRFQPVRLFHSPRAIYTQSIAHDGNAGADVVFTLVAHGLSDGDQIDLINESTGRMADDTYEIKAVPSVDTFTLYARSLDYPNKWISNVRGTGDSGTIILSHAANQFMYPLFFGRIEAVDVSYSDQVGKQISIRALDYLAGLKDEVITASLNEAPVTREAFNVTSTKVGTATGQFKGVSYPAATDATSHKLSDTIKSIVDDWSYGKDLYTDNTYDGNVLNTIGESKFEPSSFEFHGGDDGKFRHFAGRDTKVLNAMKNVAMSEKHAGSTDAKGGAGAPVTADIVYIASGGTDYAGSLVTTGANRDVVLVESNHGYENGNMVTITTDSLTAGTDHIDDAAWVVTASASGHFKIKDLGGTIKQIATANGTGRTVKISPALTGSFGYDFYLDSGFYADNVDDSDLTAHRPHLNYFLRGSRPVNPESTGLTLRYPTQGDESENVFGWGLVADSGRINTTKMFLLPQFECGLNAQDLYSHIGLAAVGSDDANPTDINDLGHKLELLKVNSISTEDWVSALPTGTAAQRQLVAAYSGVKDGRGKFHWERSDSATGLGWVIPSNGNNLQYFQLNALGSGVSIGTYGAIRVGQGGYYENNGTVVGNTGLCGLSVLPSNGRSFIDPPDTLTDPDKTTTENLLDQPAPGGASTNGIFEGGSALTAADLLKDVYNVEAEGLLSAEVTGGTHDGNASALTVTKSAHGMKTGTIIRITQLDAATSGTYGGLKVNTAPTRVNPDSDTTATGSYYRVQRVSDSTFKITDCQKHRTQITGGLGISVDIGSSRHFKYKMAYHIFKHACRIQRVTGNTWSSGTDDTVLRTSEAKTGADYALISDVKKKDKPYRGMNVNNLVAGSAGNTGGGYHPADTATSVTTEYGTLTVTSGLGWCTVPHYDGVDRFQESGDSVKVKFSYGDYLSETRFLYGDRYSGDVAGTGVRGLVGQTIYGVAESASGEHTSQDVFKSTNCKILSRMVDDKSISKTYQLKYNESASSKNTIRDAALQLLRRAVLPSKRTTSKIFGYPVIKLTGAAQAGTGHLLGNPASGADPSVLVPIDNPVAYGGRAGMLVEKTVALDGTPVNMTFPNIVNSTIVDGDLLLGGSDDGEWDAGDFYRMFIHLRAGMSVRLENPPAGVVGNHIVTSLTYYERMGTTETTLETTGYDEAQLEKFGPLATLLETIKTAGSNLKPEYITVAKLKSTASNDRIWYFGG